MKALVGAFNQEKALVGAFSVIVQPVVEPMDRFAALVNTLHTVQDAAYWYCNVQSNQDIFLLNIFSSLRSETQIMNVLSSDILRANLSSNYKGEMRFICSIFFSKLGFLYGCKSIFLKV